MQASADEHETPYRVSLVPLGVGIAWMRHCLPSHRSASVSVGLERVWADEPIAVQARPEVHATDASTLISALTGFGAGSIFHLRPMESPELPACAAPAVTIAVKPSKSVDAPSRARCQQTPRQRSPMLCRLTTSV